MSKALGLPKLPEQLGLRGCGAGWRRKDVSGGSGSRGIRDWFWFSCGVGHGGGV